jgi:lysophospholipase L1-like esterase
MTVFRNAHNRTVRVDLAAKRVACLPGLIVLCMALVAKAGEPVKIATFGTSLTAGGLWQSDLKEKLETCLDRDVEILNLGKGAEASTWGMRNVGSVVTAEPSVVLIEFAINDAYLPYQISLSESRANTEYIINELARKISRDSIFLVTTNPASKDARPNLAKYYAQYHEVARRLHVRLIDLYSKWSALSEGSLRKLIPDFVHPTRAAYKEVAIAEMAAALTDGKCH